MAQQHDSETLSKPWKDYLEQVERSFLDSPLPQDQQSLTEQSRLCEVHKKILRNHQQMIQTRLLAQDTPQELAGDLTRLAQEHAQVVSRIGERSDSIAAGIKSLEDFRRKQDKLLAWLRKMEREKLGLNLKHVQVRRIPQVLERIEVS